MRALEPARLCIIGGYQRSGTRNFADLCAAHPDISLFGEVSRNAFPLIKKHLKNLSEYHISTRDRGLELFQRKKHVLALSLLAMHAKRPRIGFSEEDFRRLRVGFTTPRVEWHWRDIVKMFDTMEYSKVFFYSCRTTEETYFSASTLGWTKGVPAFSKYMKRSLAAVLEFDNWSRQSESGWTVRPLHLNGYTASNNKGRWLKENIFKYIDPELTEEEAEGYAAQTLNRNATVKATGQERRMELSTDERAEFVADKELHALLAQLNETFDLQVRMFSDQLHHDRLQA